MKRFPKIFLLFLLSASGGFAQVFPFGNKYGVTRAYQFLNLVSTARVAAVGGNYIPIVDEDNNIVYQNPSAGNELMNHRIGVSFVNYFADIYYGYTTYSFQHPKWGTVTGGIQYINYGSFKQADEYGIVTGKFTANEMALLGNVSRMYKDKVRIGASAKLIYSQLADEFSIGAALDFGATYEYKPYRFVASAVIKNVGTQIKKYTSQGEREPLPFEIQIGASQQLAHLPLRLIVVAQHLERPDIIYEEPGEPKDTTFGQHLGTAMDYTFRHLTLGGELTIAQSLFLRFGYNHLRRRELRYDSKYGMAGFSLGFGIKISDFTLDYSFASYNVVGGTSFFSVRVPLSRFTRKKTPTTE